MKSKRHVILSLDVSTVSTGWSVFKGHALYKYGIIKIDSKKDIHEKMVTFRDSIKKLLVKYKPSIVLIEDVWMGTNAKTSKILAKFCGIAEEAIYRTTKCKPIIIVNKHPKGLFKCKTKKDLYVFLRELLGKEKEFSSFSGYNDITDSIAQAYYYIHYNIKKIRQEKEYGFLYKINARKEK